MTGIEVALSEAWVRRDLPDGALPADSLSNGSLPGDSLPGGTGAQLWWRSAPHGLSSRDLTTLAGALSATGSTLQGTRDEGIREALASWAAAQRGCWGAVLVWDEGRRACALTDFSRAFPLLFAPTAEGWLITDSPASCTSLPAQRAHTLDCVPASAPINAPAGMTAGVGGSSPHSGPDYLSHLRLDETACEQFIHLGYTLGSRSLIDGVQSLPAGSLVLLDVQHRSTPAPSSYWALFSYADGAAVEPPAGEPSPLSGEVTPHTAASTIGASCSALPSPPWTICDPSAQPAASLGDFEPLFMGALHESVERMLQATGDRPLALPLSGGLDSRLLGCVLRQHTSRPIKAFTYGRAGNREIAVSRSLADTLGLEWTCVDMRDDVVRRAWQAEGGSFIARTWAGTSLPHIQDWYALRQLTAGAQPWLEPGSVLLPGHTVVGNEHDQVALDDPAGWSEGRLVDLLVAHHAVLQARSPRGRVVSVIREEYAGLVSALPSSELQSRRASVLCGVNSATRQAAYINNSMRGYEAFGLDWALPMLDPQVVRAYSYLPRTERRVDRGWYAALTNRVIDETVGEQAARALGYYRAGVEVLPAGPRRLLMAAVTRLGIKGALNRVYTTRVQLRHPLVFNAFLPGSSPALAARMLRGEHLLGICARAMLEGDWVQSMQKHPPTTTQ